MPVLVYLDGTFEPLQIDEPFQATFQNMAGSLRNGLGFFLTKDMSGRETGIAMPHVIYIQGVED